MGKIILIETATSLCSAALCEDDKILAYKESSEPKAHASLTAVFIDQILEEQKISIADCDAVCVGMGPGSYTGLRVGVSTAKGLCFGASKPLLAVGTLEILAAQAIIEDIIPDGCKYIVPMIDARRMEAYSAVFSASGEQLTDTQPVIITEDSFSKELAEGPVLFIGDAAEKCSTMLKSPNAYFHQCWPKASSMATAAIREYKEKRFKDVAYFEPFYLKDFVATTSKKKLF